MSRKSLRVLFPLWLFLTVNIIASALAQGALPQLINSRTHRGAASIATDVPSPVHPRSTRVTIDMALLARLPQRIKEAKDGKYPRIEVRPFDDVVLTVEVRETGLEEKDHDMRYFDGYVLGVLPYKPGLSPIGTFGINLKDGVVQGTINLQVIMYEFRHVAGDGQIVRVYSPGNAPPDGQPIISDAPLKKTTAP